MIIRAYVGETITGTSVSFQDSNGNPLIGNSASWTLFDQNNNFISMGAASADGTTPGLWMATIVIPNSITVLNNQSKASVVWTLTGTTGVLAVSTEWFDLYSNADSGTYDGARTESVVFAGMNYVDAVQIPPLSGPVTNPQAILINEVGTTIQTLTVTNTNNADGSVTLGITGGTLQPPQACVFNYYMLYCTWTDVNGNAGFEARPVYSVNASTSMLCIQLRKLIDRAHLAHIHPYLAITAADLVTYVLKGFDIFNGHPPKPTLCTPINPPLGCTEIIIMAGAQEWAQSQYLAEGMHAFNFQGQGVQLEVDVTQYLSNFSSYLDTWLSKMQSYKQAFIQYGYPTANNLTIVQTVSTMSTSRGLFTNYNYRARNPGADLGYIGGGGDAWLAMGALRGWGSARL